jgi:polysaccharide export outer membrane protein
MRRSKEGEDMTILLRRLLPTTVVAAALAACSASLVNEPGGENGKTAAFTTSSQAAAPPDQHSNVQKAALSLSSVSDPNSKAYKIGPRDVLEVTVFKAPELSKVVQVSETGTISYALVGEVPAGGRTAREVEQELTKRLGAKYLQNPQISVFVKEYNSQRITIDGAVKKPGVYTIAGGMSLLQATATAGGFEAIADETVLLFRQKNGRRFAAKFDVARIREGKEEDPQLEAGDVVIAPTSDIKEGINAMFRFLPLATLVPLL